MDCKVISVKEFLTQSYPIDEPHLFPIDSTGKRGVAEAITLDAETSRALSVELLLRRLTVESVESDEQVVSSMLPLE